MPIVPEIVCSDKNYLFFDNGITLWWNTRYLINLLDEVFTTVCHITPSCFFFYKLCLVLDSYDFTVSFEMINNTLSMSHCPSSFYGKFTPIHCSVNYNCAVLWVKLCRVLCVLLLLLCCILFVFTTLNFLLPLYW